MVVGLGPVGQLAAALLGRRGMRVLAVDAAAGPSREPRATALDDESLRILQGSGARFERLEGPDVELRGAGGRAVRVPSPRSRAHGHPPLALVHQPALEAGLLGALAACPAVEVRWGTRWEELEPAGDRVRVRLATVGAGAPVEHATRWLLACDGARSPIRGALGIPFTGSSFEEPWLVVDARVPWPIGPEPRTQFVGDPARPAVNLPLGPGRHRWEFMLSPREDPAALSSDPGLARLLAPWIDLEVVEVERRALYSFHARRAGRWRDGRVLLLGDAAHVMPPFAGQGLAAGIRDAGNVAWKVADEVAGRAGPALLDSYEPERRPSVEAYTRVAVGWGAALRLRRRRAARVRDGLLAAAGSSPALVRWLERGGPRPRPVLRAGVFVPGGGGGRLLPQPEVLAGGRPARLDDVIGPRWAVLGVGEDPAARMGAQAREHWDAVGARRVAVLGPGDAPLGGAAGGTLVVEDPAGVVARWAARWGAAQVVLRPDRFVFATVGAADAGGPARAHAERMGTAARRGGVGAAPRGSR